MTGALGIDRERCAIGCSAQYADSHPDLVDAAVVLYAATLLSFLPVGVVSSADGKQATMPAFDTP